MRALALQELMIDWSDIVAIRSARDETRKAQWPCWIDTRHFTNYLRSSKTNQEASICRHRMRPPRHGIRIGVSLAVMNDERLSLRRGCFRQHLAGTPVYRNQSSFPTCLSSLLRDAHLKSLGSTEAARVGLKASHHIDSPLPTSRVWNRSTH